MFRLQPLGLPPSCCWKYPGPNRGPKGTKPLDLASEHGLWTRALDPDSEPGQPALAWTVVVGRWSLDGGRWTVVVGRWSLDGGRWTVVVGRWSLDGGRWTVVVGRWSLDGGRWTVVVGRWSLDGGCWNTGGCSV
uniref:Uncharacterized protein n=1 Tax=Knipowitschia caucasica TaxID=637954 RepID=A0AAV2MQD9_KNICA